MKECSGWVSHIVSQLNYTCYKPDYVRVIPPCLQKPSIRFGLVATLFNYVNNNVVNTAVVSRSGEDFSLWELSVQSLRSQ